MARPSNILVSTIKRNQRLRGPTSSEQQNELQAEIVRDLTVFQQEWNNKIVPLSRTIPDGTDDVLIDAFLNGLDGRTLYVHAEATNAAGTVRFYNLVKDRPNTVYEQFGAVYDYIANLGEELLAGRTIEAGDGLTGGGDLGSDLVFHVGANADGSIVVNDDDIQVGVLATDAQHGVRGGGNLHAVATTLAAGFMSAADKTALNAAVSNTRQVIAGAGLTGGGDLSADRTFNVVAGDSSITVNADNITVGVISDVQHGSRGGGSLHSVVSSGAAGFAPASGGGTANFLRADGTWAVPPGTSSGTVGGTGAANQIAYWSNGTTIAGDSELTFDGSSVQLIKTSGDAFITAQTTDAAGNAYINTIAANSIGNYVQMMALADGSVELALWPYAGKATITSAGSGTAALPINIQVASTTEVVINDDSLDADFRVESNANTHALFVDSSAAAVGVFNASPSTALDVTGTIRSSSHLIVGGSAAIAGGISLSIRTISDTDDTLTSTDYCVQVNATAPRTINLPSASSAAGQIYVIKKLADDHDISITANGSDTIDQGSSTRTLQTRYHAMTIQSDGTSNWNIISRYEP